jgi:hypothetical protein
MAIASPRVSAVTVEATEFPELAHRFSVQGVPRMVVNRGGAFVGALPEERFVAAVLELAGVETDGEKDLDAAADAEPLTEPFGEGGEETAAETRLTDEADGRGSAQT